MKMITALGRYLVILLFTVTIIEASDIFDYKIILSKYKVYQGESLKATLQLTYKKDITPISIDFGDFILSHFTVKELGKKTIDYKGDNVIVQKKYIITPYTHGNLTINHTVNVALREAKTGFIKWNAIKSNSINLSIKQLPSNINIVGNYTIDISVDKKSVDENKPINCTVKISGFGNIADINPIKLSILNSIVYKTSPEIDVKFINNHYKGIFIQKFSIISNKTFIIPSIKFNYFDLESNSIKTLQTKPIKIEVNSTYKHIEYIYGVVGFLCGIGIFYILTRKQKIKNDDLPIEVKIKKSKNNKELYNILLPYSNDKNIDKVIKQLEENIYKNGKNKIDKNKILKYFFV